MAQMKEQIKTPENELNKMDISNLSDAEFKTLVRRMLKEPSKNLNRIKRSIWSDIKDTLIEMQNNVQGNNSEWMKLRIKSIIWNIRKKNQPIKTTRRKKEYKKQEDSVSNLWDNFKRSNICIIGVPEEEEQEIGNLKKQ